jgi:hypothetical protein
MLQLFLNSYPGPLPPINQQEQRRNFQSKLQHHWLTHIPNMNRYNMRENRLETELAILRVRMDYLKRTLENYSKELNTLLEMKKKL